MTKHQTMLTDEQKAQADEQIRRRQLQYPAGLTEAATHVGSRAVEAAIAKICWEVSGWLSENAMPNLRAGVEHGLLLTLPDGATQRSAGSGHAFGLEFALEGVHVTITHPRDTHSDVNTLRVQLRKVSGELVAPAPQAVLYFAFDAAIVVEADNTNSAPCGLFRLDDAQCWGGLDENDRFLLIAAGALLGLAGVALGVYGHLAGVTTWMNFFAALTLGAGMFAIVRRVRRALLEVAALPRQRGAAVIPAVVYAGALGGVAGVDPRGERTLTFPAGTLTFRPVDERRVSVRALRGGLDSARHWHRVELLKPELTGLLAAMGQAADDPELHGALGVAFRAADPAAKLAQFDGVDTTRAPAWQPVALHEALAHQHPYWTVNFDAKANLVTVALASGETVQIKLVGATYQLICSWANANVVEGPITLVRVVLAIAYARELFEGRREVPDAVLNTVHQILSDLQDGRTAWEVAAEGLFGSVGTREPSTPVRAVDEGWFEAVVAAFWRTLALAQLAALGMSPANQPEIGALVGTWLTCDGDDWIAASPAGSVVVFDSSAGLAHVTLDLGTGATTRVCSTRMAATIAGLIAAARVCAPGTRYDAVTQKAINGALWAAIGRITDGGLTGPAETRDILESASTGVRKMVGRDTAVNQFLSHLANTVGI